MPNNQIPDSQQDKITKDMVSNWINHPITHEMLRITEEHLNGCTMTLSETIVNGPSLTNIDLHRLSQLKGQILAFREVLDTKEYLIELVEGDQNA